MLRIVLFLATNLAVLFMAAIAMAALTALGIIPPDAPYISMLVWCALFGFGGAILSLALSKTIAKASTRAKVIETPSNDVERWLVSTVERQAKRAGIGMPEVAVFDSPDPNAFATGPQSPLAVGLVLLNISLFGASAYFLLTGDSADFFKQQSVKPPQSAAR